MKPHTRDCRPDLRFLVKEMSGAFSTDGYIAINDIAYKVTSYDTSAWGGLRESGSLEVNPGDITVELRRGATLVRICVDGVRHEFVLVKVASIRAGAKALTLSLGVDMGASQ